MEGYELGPVDASERAITAITALLQTAFPGAQHFTEAVVRWQYKENPEGAAVGTNAWHGEELAAHYVTLPMQAMVHGKPEKGLLSLNTATHPNHQGKGLFTKLAKATYAAAAEAGYGFVVGVANTSSTPGFIRKLGFELVSPLRAMVGVGPLPPRDPREVPAFLPVHNPAFLAWRLKHPAYAYTAYTEGKRTYVLSGRRQFGARYILGEAENPLPAALLPMEQGNVPAKVWIGFDPGMRWAGRPYVNIPMRFRPSPLNFIFRDLTEQGRKLDARTVRFSPMDFDVM